MASFKPIGISSDRVRGPLSVNTGHLTCCICWHVLWKPVACQSCETPFCSTCINRWLVDNPTKCPIRCEPYTERKCPPFIAKLLTELQIACACKSRGCQQIISYEALEKHEQQCGHQPQQCPGCRSEILKKDFNNHTNNCAQIELTCPDCKLVYARGMASTKHTENICLKQQLRQLHDESKDNKREIYELKLQLSELCISNPSLNKTKITFDDLPNAEAGTKRIPSIYRQLKWTGIDYVHELFLKKDYPKSGCVTSFMPGSSPHIAFFSKEASINAEQANKTFTLISVSACAAWNDDLKLTIKGSRNSVETNMHTATLLFGKPQLILLQWKDVDKVTFGSSGGTAHPGTGSGSYLHVVITQLTIAFS